MFVIKIGGNELDDPDFIDRMGEAIAAIEVSAILVHGGGKEIRELQQRLGVTPQYIKGLRITDEASLDIVKMVLAGRINKRLVASLLTAGVDAFGMSGIDRAAIKAVKLEHPEGDLGQVGRVVEVRTEVFSRFLEDDTVPVLSPICYGPDGSTFNVNADHVAQAVAIAMQAEVLIFVSNVPGVLREGELLPRLTTTDIERLIDEKVIVDGMIPKVQSAVEAVNGGVAAVRITNLEGLKAGTWTTIIK